MSANSVPKEMDYDAFAEKGCLPTQWIKYLEGQRLRPPTADQ